MNLYDQAAQMIEDLYDSNHPDHTAETVMDLTGKLREASKAFDEVGTLLQKCTDERDGRRGLSSMSKLFAQSVLREGQHNTRIRELITQLTKE